MDIDNRLEQQLVHEINIKNEQIAELVIKIKELEYRIVNLETRNQMVDYYTRHPY